MSTTFVTPRRLAAWALLIAVMAAVAAGLGVFARGDGAFVTVTSVHGESYDMATTGVYANNALAIVAEGVGWDVFTLFVAVPALVASAALTARSSFRGMLLTGGLFGYFMYLHLEYAVTWAFGPLFPLFVAILAATVVGLVGAAVLLVRGGVAGRFSSAYPRRQWAAVSLTLSVLLLGLWTLRIAEGLASSPPTLHGETTMTVQALDLGLLVPVSVVIAVATLRRHPAGLAAGASFAVTFVMLAAAVATMMVSSWIVTTVSALAPIVLFGAAALAGLWVTVRMYRSAVPPALALNLHATIRLDHLGQEG